MDLQTGEAFDITSHSILTNTFPLPRERLDYVNEIKNNIHESIYELCKYVKILGLEFDSSDNNNLANYILKIERFNSTSVSDVSTTFFIYLYLLISQLFMFDGSDVININITYNYM